MSKKWVGHASFDGPKFPRATRFPAIMNFLGTTRGRTANRQREIGADAYTEIGADTIKRVGEVLKGTLGRKPGRCVHSRSSFGRGLAYAPKAKRARFDIRSLALSRLEIEAASLDLDLSAAFLVGR